METRSITMKGVAEEAAMNVNWAAPALGNFLYSPLSKEGVAVVINPVKQMIAVIGSPTHREAYRWSPKARRLYLIKFSEGDFLLSLRGNKEFRLCPCCDRRVAPGRRFVQGHDGRIKGIFVKAVGGRLDIAKFSHRMNMAYDQWRIDMSISIKRLFKELEP